MAKKAKPTEKSVATTSPRIRNKGLRLVRVADIEDNPLNFRKHPEAQRAAFAGIETEIGFYGYPDAYETEAGTIRLIDGQLRKEHLLSKYGNDATIEVNITDFNEDEARLALTTHDPIAAMAAADCELLDTLLRSITSESGEVADLLLSIGKNAGCEWSQDQEEFDTSPQLPQGLQFRIVVECEDEFHQSRLLDKFNAEGLMCKGAVI